MRTPVWQLIIAPIFLFNISFAQTTGKSIKLYGHGYNLAVNKNKQLAITTNNGEVAFANTANGVWRKSLIEAKADGKPGEKALVENICYFNADTAFVWGDMYGYNGVNDRIYLTVNKGKSWQPVKLGVEGKVSDAVYLNNGEAWLNLKEKGIAYTKDYGFTWIRLAVPYPNLARRMLYTKIFFNNKNAGIIGSPWNALAYTGDNCKHFTIITTPYSQEYAKNKKFYMPPQVNRVAIYKDYLLVRQGNSVYYSRVDTINWMPLPEYKDFYTDPENKALFFERNSGGFVKADSTLQPVCSFGNIKDHYSAISRNGSLYVLGMGRLWQVNASNKLSESKLDFIAASRPVYLGHGKGYIGNKVYTGRGDKWLYAFALPFSTDGGSLYMKDAETISFTRADSVFYYHIENGKVDKGNGKETMSNFVAGGVKKIIFTRGSASCYRSHQEKFNFWIQDNQFVSSSENNIRDSAVTDCPYTIDRSTVEEFVKKIPAIYAKQVSIDELEFTQQEYDTCKLNILEFRSTFPDNRNKEYHPFSFETDIDPDFEKLMPLVDSVKTIKQEMLSQYFLSQGEVSVVQHWHIITLVNNRDEELEIKSDMYASGLFFPWQVKLNGLYSLTTAIEINKFIKAVFPGFLDNGERRLGFLGNRNRRINVIQELVKYLYFKTE